MHSHDLAALRHEHVFDRGNPAGESGTRLVMWITAATMVAEIAAGCFYNSMALLADGLHMSSHAVAIGLSAFAYATARRHAQDSRYAFGPWKVEVLGGFASAVLMLAVIALMLFGSIERLLSPEPIQYREALLVAGLGLLVNVVSALILGAAHHHGDHHHHGHGETHHDGRDHGQDLNLRSAYLHVLADAATSVLAMAALVGGWIYGWVWLDPLMGVVGAVVVALWARRLVQDSGKVLLDREMDAPVVQEIRDVVAEQGAASQTLITDLHVWRVGRSAYSLALALVTHDAQLDAGQVRQWLSVHEEIVHSTIEIQLYRDDGGGARQAC